MCIGARGEKCGKSDKFWCLSWLFCSTTSQTWDMNQQGRLQDWSLSGTIICTPAGSMGLNIATQATKCMFTLSYSWCHTWFLPTSFSQSGEKGNIPNSSQWCIFTGKSYNSFNSKGDIWAWLCMIHRILPDMEGNSFQAEETKWTKHRILKIWGILGNILYAGKVATSLWRSMNSIPSYF